LLKETGGAAEAAIGSNKKAAVMLRAAQPTMRSERAKVASAEAPVSIGSVGSARYARCLEKAQAAANLHTQFAALPVPKTTAL